LDFKKHFGVRVVEVGVFEGNKGDPWLVVSFGRSYGGVKVGE